MQIENKIFKDFMNKKLNTNNNWLYFIISDNGIELTCCVPTIVSMSTSTLNKKCVTGLKAINGKILINNLDRFEKIISNIGDSKLINMDITDTSIIIKTDTETHNLCRMDESTLEDFPIPNLDFEDGVTFNIKLQTLKRIITMSQTFTDKSKPNVKFIINKTSISYELESNGESVQGTPLNITTKNDKEFFVIFPMEYFSKVISSLSSEMVQFNLKPDYPLQINEKLGDFITTKFIVAPYIDNEEQSDEDEQESE